MKRTALKRGKELARKAGLSRGEKPLERRTALTQGNATLERGTGLQRGEKRLQRSKPKPMSDDERAAQAAWYAYAVTAAPGCAVCGLTHKDAKKKRIRLQGHHVVPQQRLVKIAKERGIPEWYLLWDDRNSMCLCEPCHARHTDAFMDSRAGVDRRVPFALLTDENLAFASSVREDEYILRTYPRSAA